MLILVRDNERFTTWTLLTLQVVLILYLPLLSVEPVDRHLFISGKLHFPFSILWLPFFPLISLKKGSEKGPFGPFWSLLTNFSDLIFKVDQEWAKGPFSDLFSKKLREKKEVKEWKSEQNLAHSLFLLFHSFTQKERNRTKKEAKGKCSFSNAASTARILYQLVAICLINPGCDSSHYRKKNRW